MAPGDTDDPNRRPARRPSGGRAPAPQPLQQRPHLSAALSRDAPARDRSRAWPAPAVVATAGRGVAGAASGGDPMNQVMLKANDPCWCGSGRKYKRCHKGTEGRVLPGRVSPMLAVPEGIAPTGYYRSGHPARTDEPIVKSTAVIERMRVAGRVAAEVLAVTGAA